MTNIGRYCALNGIEEVSDLKAGMDFRLPQHRRETFLRFYQAHEELKAHPGGVYFSIPYLAEKFSMTMEQKLWLCFINGVSQNILTSFRIWEKFPNLSDFDSIKFSDWFRVNYEKFGWDVDRRYVKNKLEKVIASYQHNLAGRTQEEYFKSFCLGTPEENFQRLWTEVMTKFAFFGRLSTFSYLEYLKIAGLPLECNTLFLDDISGSKSHRNGLCKLLGRDDLDWTNDNPVTYTPELLDWLKAEGEQLLKDAKERVPTASYFTLESTLCCWKSWHRINRRYTGVYLDMMWERVKRDEQMWGEENTLFRQMRKDCVPVFFRIEDNPRDPGLKPEKQNHYRLTGQVPMLNFRWACFKNDFNDKYYG